MPSLPRSHPVWFLAVLVFVPAAAASFGGPPSPPATPSHLSEVTVDLSLGWNNMSLSSSPTVPDHASHLIESLRQDDFTVHHVARFHNGAWQSYLPGFGPEDFPLQYGRGYFVRVSGPGRWRP